MRTIGIIIAVTMMASSPSAFSQTVPETYDNREWVVVIDDPRPARLKGWQRPGYSKSGASYHGALELERFGTKMASKYNMQLKDQWLIQSLGVYCLVVRFKGDGNETVESLKKNKRVKWVQRSNDFRLLATQMERDLVGSELASSKSDDLLNQHSLPNSINGEGVVIAIVDSAVDQSHQDLVEAINKSDNFVVAGTPPNSGEAHGTAIAGVMVAQRDSKLGVAGVAPGAKLNAYRGCWEEPVGKTQCNTLSLARALDAVTRSNADILNLSLSGPKDNLLDRLVAKVIKGGAIVVTAFDPARANTERFPTQREGVLVVRAESLDPMYGDVFTAPGERIVAFPGNRYNFMKGHSVASAYASGVIALCKQAQASKRQTFKKRCDWQKVSDSTGAGDLMSDLLNYTHSAKIDHFQARTRPADYAAIPLTRQ